MNNPLPADVQAALEGLGVVTYDGAQAARSEDVYSFTIRDPEFSKCQLTFYIRESQLSPSSFLAAYARTIREFAVEFTKQN